MPRHAGRQSRPRWRALAPGAVRRERSGAGLLARVACLVWLAGASTGVSAIDTDYSVTLDQLWDFDAPAVSEARFRAERERQAPRTREALEAATQLARTLGLQRRFAEADALLDDVHTELEHAPARVRVRYSLERGRVRNSSGEPQAAVPLFNAALQASDDDRLPGAEFYRVDALHMLGIAAPADARMAWNEKALALAESTSDPRAREWRGSLLHNLGWAEHDAGHYDAALGYWQRALALREAAGGVARIRVAKWTVARGLRSLGRLDEAEAMQRALAAETERAGAPDGFVYEELAEIALARHDETAARPWAAKAYALLKSDVWIAANEQARLARLERLGSVAP